MATRRNQNIQPSGGREMDEHYFKWSSDQFPMNYYESSDYKRFIASNKSSRKSKPIEKIKTIKRSGSNINDRESECNEHTDCPTGHYCHSGWNGTEYGPRFCLDAHPENDLDFSEYCDDHPCGIGDGDCDDNSQCAPGLLCGGYDSWDTGNNCDFHGVNGINRPNADCCEAKFTFGGKIYGIIDSNNASDDLMNKIYRWCDDVLYESYNYSGSEYNYDEVVIYMIDTSPEGASAEDIRSLLSDGYYYDNLAGAFLIGDIPMSWTAGSIYEERTCESDSDCLEFGWYGWTCHNGYCRNVRPSHWRYQKFYIDFPDSDNDGLFEEPNHGSGSYFNDPFQIFIGLLRTNGCGTDEPYDCLDWELGGYENSTEALKKYFDKNHEYRTGNIGSIDNDVLILDILWNYDLYVEAYSSLTPDIYGQCPPEWNCGGLSGCHGYEDEYGDDACFSTEDTNKSDVINYLNSNNRIVGAALGHSSPWNITFSHQPFPEDPSICDWMSDGACFEHLDWYDVIDLYNIPYFLFLHGCAIGLYTEVNNVVNWSLFNPNSKGSLVTFAPIAVIPSNAVYPKIVQLLSNGMSIGDAYKIWSGDNWISWGGYGQADWVLLGDPTLRIPEYELGDVNFDFSVDIFDAVTIVQHILGEIQLTEVQQQLADVTQDGTVNVSDVMMLVDMVLGGGYELTSSQQQQLQDALNRLRSIPEGTRVKVDGSCTYGGMVYGCADERALNYWEGAESCSDSPRPDYSCCIHPGIGRWPWKLS